MTSSPLLLAFDTSGPHCSAALIRGSDLLAQKTEEMSKGQAERLFPLLEELMTEHRVTWENLEGIGVGIGPGNFTGIRLSVSAARGLAVSLGRPAIGVSMFEALTFGYDAPVLCSLDARRDRVYAQLLNDTPMTPVHCHFDDVPLPSPKAEAAVIGHRAQELADRTGGVVLQPAYPLAEAIARKAVSRLDKAQGPAPAPLYIKPADAAPSRVAPPPLLS